MFEPLFNSFKIKYTILNELLKDEEYIKKSSTTPINIFINLDSVFKNLCTRNIDEGIRSNDRRKLILEMISDIFNLGAHYKNYFSKMNKKVELIFYAGYPYNKNKYKNLTFNKFYRKNFNDKINSTDNIMIKNIFEESIKLAKYISDYMNKVYILTSDIIEPSLIPYVYNNKISTESHHNIIITKDKYDYQYINKNYTILRPKKNSEDYVIKSNNFLDVLKVENKINNPKIINNDFYPFILSLLGESSRNIEKIKHVGLSSTINMIITGIKKGMINESSNSIYVLLKLIKDEYKTSVLNNFFMIDLDSQLSNLNIHDIYLITSQKIDKFDNKSLKEINDRYFQNYPIYLNDLIYEPISNIFV